MIIPKFRRYEKESKSLMFLCVNVVYRVVMWKRDHVRKNDIIIRIFVMFINV